MLLHWPHLALQAGEEEQALQGAAAACQALPNSSAVWEQRLSLQARHATLQVLIYACLVQPLFSSGVLHESERWPGCMCHCMPASKHQLSVCAGDMSVQAFTQHVPQACKEWPYLSKLRPFDETEVDCCGRCVNQVKLNKQVPWRSLPGSWKAWRCKLWLLWTHGMQKGCG